MRDCTLEEMLNTQELELYTSVEQGQPQQSEFSAYAWLIQLGLVVWYKGKPLTRGQLLAAGLD